MIKPASEHSWRQQLTSLMSEVKFVFLAAKVLQSKCNTLTLNHRPGTLHVPCEPEHTLRPVTFHASRISCWKQA